MSHIKGIGLELEGGWHREFDDAQIGSDGSVRCPSNITRATGHFGELVSPVLTMETWEEWLRKHYPNGTDTSCGFHIHLSFGDIRDYDRLIKMKFYRYFLLKWAEWGEELMPAAGATIPQTFHERLGKNGRFNSYAQRIFQPSKQLHHNYKADGRRCHLNFCYGLHGTMENRLLPMFEEKELGVAAVRYYLEMVNTYLDMVASKGDVIFDTAITVGGRRK